LLRCADSPRAGSLTNNEAPTLLERFKNCCLHGIAGAVLGIVMRKKNFNINSSSARWGFKHRLSTIT
jgi:hypothetical protein